MNSEDALSAFLYFVTIVTSLGSAGSLAEACAGDLIICTDRGKSLVAFGFLTALVAIALLAVCVSGISMFRKLECFVSPIVVLFAIVACAIGTSVKTSPVISLPTLLVWYSLIAASGAMFLAFKNMGAGNQLKEKLVDPNPVSIPMTGSVLSSTQPQPAQPIYAAPQ